MLNVHLTMKSSNAKTGPMPVSTTSKASCPNSCSLKGSGCYAEAGPLGIHWAAVSNGKRGTDWSSFCATISSLPDGIVWRHNQAGDLPSDDNININPSLVYELIKANVNKKGFTYTHYKPSDGLNYAIINYSNKHGFTINLSAESLSEADTLVDLNIGPVVTLLPEVSTKVTYTPAGRKVVTCPAFHNDKVSCYTCKLCQRQDRPIIGFPVHGTSKKKAAKVFAIKSII
jgi:hypothetical protein